MTQRECIRCQRLIDAEARICPFCNQEHLVEARDGPPRVVQEPEERRYLEIRPEESPRQRSWWSVRLIAAAGIAALLIGSFAVGGILYALSNDRDDEGPATPPAETARKETTRSDFPDLELVLDDPSALVGRSATSQPIPDPDHKFSPEARRSDLTAVPSTEYQKVQEQKPPPSEEGRFEAADPRTIRAPLIPHNPPRPRPSPPAPGASGPGPASVGATTPPVPISKPLPALRPARGNVRVELTVSPTGEVSDVRVIEGASRQMREILSSLNRWRFRPATRGGQPIEGRYQVNIILGE